MSDSGTNSKARNLPKRQSRTPGPPVNDGSSPALRTSKRKTSEMLDKVEPPAKRMADNEILAAINDVGKSVVAMEKQLQNCCTKQDLSIMTREIRAEVQANTNRIDQLFEMRKEDKKLEQIVDIESNPACQAADHRRPVPGLKKPSNVLT